MSAMNRAVCGLLKLGAAGFATCGFWLLACSSARIDEPDPAPVVRNAEAAVVDTWSIDGVVSVCPTQSGSFATHLPGNGIQDKPVTIVVAASLLDESDDEKHPLRQAVKDLQRDLKGLLGIEPVLGSVPSGAYNSIVVTMPGFDPGNYHDAALNGWEQHRISTKAVGNRKHVILDGADLRGAIYAIYMFSDKVLGVPPLWYWMEWQPTPLANGRHFLEVPTNACRSVASPETKYRTFFFNNGSFYSPWRKPPMQSLDEDKMSAVFETLHRLKVNTFYDDGGIQTIQIANERGLLGIHNLATLSDWDDYFGTPDDDDDPVTPEVEDREAVIVSSLSQWCPAGSYANPGASKFVQYWAGQIREILAKGGDVTWLLGALPIQDTGGLWTDLHFPGNSNPQDKGDLLEAFSACQHRLLVEALGTPYPRTVFYLWNEVDGLYANGHLQPTGTTISFGNTVRTHVPSPSLTVVGARSELGGYYQNLHMVSSGSFLVDAVGPWKAVEGFRQARAIVGPLRFGMINVGNFRPFLLSAATVSEMWWDIGQYPATDTSIKRVLARHLPSRTTAQIEDLRKLHREFLSDFWQQAPDSPNLPERQYVWEDLRMRGASLAATQAIIDHLPVQTSPGLFYSEVTRDDPNSPFDSADPICPCVAADCTRCSGYTTATRFDDAIVSGLSPTTGSTGSIAKWRGLLTRANGVRDYRYSVEQAEKTFVLDQLEVPLRTAIEAARVNYFAMRAAQVYETDRDQARTYLCTAKGATLNMHRELAVSDHGVFEGYFGNSVDDGKWATDTLRAHIDDACTDLWTLQHPGQSVPAEPCGAAAGDCSQ
jgi:Glycosyl hydrolase family 115